MRYDFGEVSVAGTTLDRLVFPADGVCKQVLAYYHDVAPVMLPELQRRPLTIERFTKSIDDGGFFQKHTPKRRPWASLRTHPASAAAALARLGLATVSG